MALPSSTEKKHRKEQGGNALDKNVIFIYPLNAFLNELKKELEKDESFSVLEVDMLSEYEPLIQSISNSVTFSADVKKTAMFLDTCKKYTRSKNHLNILISKQTPSGLVLSRMEKDGLNEFQGDFIKLKAVMIKINHFYKDFGQKVSPDTSSGINQANHIENSSDSTIPRDSSLIDVPNVDKTMIPYSIQSKKRPQLASDWTGVEENIETQSIAHSSSAQPEISSSGHLESNPVQTKKKLSLSKEIGILSEITFFPGLRIFDPIAFYMEILLNKSDNDFKKKYLKMCLSKVYGAKLYTSNSEGLWEESTPDSLLEYNSADCKLPIWINEGRNEVENFFIMPIILDEVYLGGIGLVLPGQINHEKMLEMEFWCYLGRCLCN